MTPSLDRDAGRRPTGRAPGDLPWWLLLIVLGATLALVRITGDAAGRETLRVLSRGLEVTIRVTLFGFAMALVLGLLLGLGRVSRLRLAREVSTLYVEVIRGFPMLVLLLWIGFVLVPGTFGLVLDLAGRLVGRGIELGGLAPALLETCRRPSDCISLELRGIVGLGMGYGAYVAEIVRAGIQSVPAGQLEAAYSLGMSRRQAMRRVVLPQGLRLSLPPLGNDFIAMLKDSALVSVLTVPDMVYEARVHVAKTFQALEVWNVVALLYLILTLSLSLGVRWLEKRSSWPGGGS